MPPDPTPPLPLAANRAALSNRISMLLASQSSVLKTMKLTRPDPSTRPRRGGAAGAHDDNDDDLLRGPRPNEGVGFAPEAKGAPKAGGSREERMLLRGSNRGRRAEEQMQRHRRKRDESESEDEVGRSALGKRKRPRKERVQEQEQEQEEDEGATVKEGEETKINAGGSVEKSVDVDMCDANNDTNDTPVVDGKDDKEGDAQQVNEGDDGARKKRKKKNKRKNKSMAA